MVIIGLDNGITIKRKDGKKIELPSFIKRRWTYTDANSDEIEIAYWRKCWGIRERILLAINTSAYNGYYPVDSESLLKILDVLYKFLHKDYWDKYADSIWDYDEYIEYEVQNIINLSWLSSYMEQAKDNLIVQFYDSY